MQISRRRCGLIRSLTLTFDCAPLSLPLIGLMPGHLNLLFFGTRLCLHCCLQKRRLSLQTSAYPRFARRAGPAERLATVGWPFREVESHRLPVSPLPV